MESDNELSYKEDLREEKKRGKMIKGRVIRRVIGWPLLILGVLGLALPVLQGVLFLSIAFLLLAPDVPLFRRILRWIEKRHPGIAGKANKIINGGGA